MSAGCAEEVLEAINAAREEENVPELVEIKPSELNYAYSEKLSIQLSPEDVQEGDSNKEKILSKVKTMLSTECEERAVMMARVGNFFMFDITESESGEEAIIYVINKYVDVDNVGPFIDGNLVLQLTSHNPQENVPAICKVEFAADYDESFETISTIMPWEMIYTPPDGDGTDSCAVPISLDPQYFEGSVRITIYVSSPDSVSHGEEVQGYSPDWKNMIPAVYIQTSSRSPENIDEKLEQAAALAYPAVLDIKVSCSANWEAELFQDGMQVNFVDLIKGFNETSEAGEWKFHVGVNTGNVDDSTMQGVEDVIFIEKESGEEFEVPEGYNVDATDIIHEDESKKRQVRIAYRLGPNPRYSWVLPMSCEEADEKEAEMAFQRYVDQLGGGAEVRMAPAEVNQLHGFRVGLLLVYKENDLAEAVFSGETPLAVGDGQEQLEGENRSDERSGQGGDNDINEEKKEDEDMSKMTGEFSSEDDFSDDEVEDKFAIDEQATLALQKKLQELEEEKENHLALNAELQKKCCAILARIGRDQSRGGNDQDLMDPSSTTENNTEKEGHFNDCVTAISDGRSRLLRQQGEYDQYALDLQGKLDDKEFKAEEIMDSLKEFKREIMLKAENSRTGQGISKRVIKQYEQSERKKDEELEKVRLRNISLKTTLRRLEKTLRSREQLAEGLHMIDFEQLKIENQTLSEKIEERNEELAKLKRKKTVTVQILTHIREKLRYVSTQNQFAREELQAVDAQINKERSVLTTSKHDRDSIREDNVELKRQRGFATSDLLILDFEKRKHTMEELANNIEELKERYFLLTQQIERNTKTINRSKNISKTALPPI